MLVSVSSRGLVFLTRASVEIAEVPIEDIADALDGSVSDTYITFFCYFDITRLKMCLASLYNERCSSSSWEGKG